MSNNSPNPLIHAASPYLLQHAYNPVHWQEWSAQAWQKARDEDRPVLVSIGYSACHWCHVMEHESFENDDTAALMNEFFINIKVDREERPDVDQIYMDAVQLMNGRGGWPLNIFCLPDGRPIYGGTYFPNKQWNQLLFRINHIYREQKAEAEDYAEKVKNGLKALDELKHDSDETLLNFDDFRIIEGQFAAGFDYEWGGNNRVPKFPMPVNIELLRMMSVKTGFTESRKMLAITLDKMASGGIYDHVGGGFARYATDREWLIPHFEKMLYDNGQLIGLYASSGLQTDAAMRLEHYSAESARFCIENMRHDGGGFFSAFDADSEGEEGKYYTWIWDEIEQILGTEATEFAALAGCNAQGNWEHGQNIIHLPAGLTSINAGNIDFWKKCLEKLGIERTKRIAPGLDDKIITAWNGLMLSGLCRLYRAGGDLIFLEAAQKAADFLLETMSPEGRLLRSWRNGVNGPFAFLEDYALLIAALTDLGASGAGEKYFLKAKLLITEALDLFYDTEKGLFNFSPRNGEQLIASKTDVTDDVIPSANAIMSGNLMWLGLLFGDPNLLQVHEKMQSKIRPMMRKNPGWYSYWLQNEWLRNSGAWQIVISGPDSAKYAAILRKGLIDFPVIEADKALHLPICNGKSGAAENKIYVCEWEMCHAPFSKPQEAMDFIAAAHQRG